ncbi:translation initiation factor IF-2 [Aerococcaceae bacterium DSM 111021]|nr:translation initiation factor IF-2 [Aerococcaceae bacterium DSM 111021]
MTKRVYEYAKEHDLTSKALLTMAETNGLEFGSHMSSITDDQEKQLNKIISNKNTKKIENKEKASQQASNKETKTSSNETNAIKQTSDKKQTKQNQNKKEESKTNTKQSNTPNKNAGSNNTSNQAGRRNRRNRRGKGNKNFKNTESKGITQRKHKDLPEKLVYTDGTNIQEIAKMLHRDTSEIIKKLMMNGVMANQNQALSKEVIELIAIEYGVEPEEKVVVDVSDLDVYFEEEQDASKLSIRPAVVTIMGHVDHGKTTLLDQLRHSRVTEDEAGGITQHIGAYQVETEDDNIITFLDTPGHEAFTTMRARGADVTDIAIIVVAADDGVMPQTVEAINHAKVAEVPIIIAVNKIDKPTANPDRVKQELSEHGIISEDWGGENIFVEISAKFNQNIEELLEMIVLVAEVQELKANPSRLAIGSVIEARLDKSQGPTATLLVQDGTLNVGDPIVVGNTYGRVRTMVNDIGRRIRTAGPATPVEITGLQNAPQAGDLFVVFEDEKTARQAGEQRAQEAQDVQRSLTKKITLDNLFDSLQEGELKSVNVIIKADVQGSAEALSASLQKIEVEGVRVNVVHQAVGAINESDISLAAASGAIVLGFNVRPTPQARLQADSEVVDIRQYRVIYDAIDEIETAMKGMLDPEYEEEVQGQALVRETFTVSKLGTIAGSFVTDGYIARDSQVRLLRDNIVIYEGELASLKRFKDDAKQVDKGYECGIMIENYNDVRMDDVIEAFHMVEIKR